MTSSKGFDLDVPKEHPITLPTKKSGVDGFENITGNMVMQIPVLGIKKKASGFKHVDGFENINGWGIPFNVAGDAPGATPPVSTTPPIMPDSAVTTKPSMHIFKSVGTLAGIGFGVYRKVKLNKSAWGILGWGLLGAVVGSIADGIINNIPSLTKKDINAANDTTKKFVGSDNSYYSSFITQDECIGRGGVWKNGAAGAYCKHGSGINA